MPIWRLMCTFLLQVYMYFLIFVELVKSPIHPTNYRNYLSFYSELCVFLVTQTLELQKTYAGVNDKDLCCNMMVDFWCDTFFST